MMFKTTIERPNNLSSIVNDDFLREENRYKILDHLKGHIPATVQSIDPIVVSGIWSLLRTTMIHVLYANPPENYEEKIDSLNISNLMKVVDENVALFKTLVLKDPYLCTQFDVSERLLYHEDIPASNIHSHCIITNLPIPFRSRVDKILLKSKNLHISREKYWKREGYESISTLEFFRLVWHIKTIKSRVKADLSGMLASSQNGIETKTLLEYMAVLILEFRLFDDLLVTLVSK